jgi:hypothetical protein
MPRDEQDARLDDQLSRQGRRVAFLGCLPTDPPILSGEDGIMSRDCPLPRTAQKELKPL